MDRIARYELRRRLGAGAFATVWLAHDPDLDVLVAVKVLADNWSAHLDVRERFLAEARLLRRISDDRVVRVHDIGELPVGRSYFVMDHADGGTVADLLREGVDASTALRVGAEAARGVQVLHDHGIVHRDVKPANLLLCSSLAGPTHVVVADLGMAKSLAEASGLTVAAGTPAYMAPEQAHGRGGLDQRADVYAVAAVTYALLCGTPPHAAESGVGAVAVREPEAGPPLLAPRLPVPVELDVVLRAALAHDPARRPRTAAELARRLDGIRRQVESGDFSTVGAPAQWDPRSITALAAAALAVCLGAAWLTLRLLS